MFTGRKVDTSELGNTKGDSINIANHITSSCVLAIAKYVTFSRVDAIVLVERNRSNVWSTLARHLATSGPGSL
jgi:hypothetical protein